MHSAVKGHFRLQTWKISEQTQATGPHDRTHNRIGQDPHREVDAIGPGAADITSPTFHIRAAVNDGLPSILSTTT